MCNTKKNLTRATAFILSALFVLLAFFPVVTWATPEDETVDVTDETTEHIVVSTGWVEAQCEVPEGFRDLIFVVIENTTTFQQYTLVCAKDTRYAGWAEVPCGEYSVSYAYQRNDEIEYDVVVSPQDFTVEEHAKKATLLTARLVGNDDTYVEHEYDQMTAPSEPLEAQPHETQSGDPTAYTPDPNDTYEDNFTEVQPTVQTPVLQETEPAPTEPESHNPVENDFAQLLFICGSAAVLIGFIVIGFVVHKRKNNG
jgi:hypothetical protein